MIGLSYNPLGIFNSSGLVNIGEGYDQTGFNYQTINSEGLIAKKEYVYYINRDGMGINVTGLNSGDFPWTTNWPSGVVANILN